MLVGLLVLGWVLVRVWRRGVSALGKALRRRPGRPAGPAEVVPAARAGFGAYRDPFAGGWAGRMTLAELTAYTFEALEAWARDGGCPRGPEQTPGEFGQALAERWPWLADEVRGTARLYSRVAYGGEVPGEGAKDLLARLWAGLRRPE